MHRETYHGFEIVIAPAGERLHLTITDPRGAADTVTLAGSVELVARRARRTIDTITDYQTGRCRCGSPAVCTDDDGERCCVPCAARRYATT